MTKEIPYRVGIWTPIVLVTFQYLRVFIIVKENSKVNYHEQEHRVIKKKMDPL